MATSSPPPGRPLKTFDCRSLLLAPPFHGVFRKSRRATPPPRGGGETDTVVVAPFSPRGQVKGPAANVYNLYKRPTGNRPAKKSPRAGYYVYSKLNISGGYDAVPPSRFTREGPSDNNRPPRPSPPGRRREGVTCGPVKMYYTPHPALCAP